MFLDKSPCFRKGRGVEEVLSFDPTVLEPGVIVNFWPINIFDFSALSPTFKRDNLEPPITCNL